MIRLAENLRGALLRRAEARRLAAKSGPRRRHMGSVGPCAQFWTDGNAAYGKTDGSVCVAGEITDADEARAFLSAVGDKRSRVQRGECRKAGVKHHRKRRDPAKGAAQLRDGADPGGDISPRDVYAVLKANNMAGEFEPFYLDLSHRMRHGTVRCAGVSADGKTVAVAAAVLGESASLV